MNSTVEKRPTTSSTPPRSNLIHEHELDAGCRILYQAPEIFRGVSLNVEERDDDRQHDHLFDHKESAAAMDDHQVSGWATLSELQMITGPRCAVFA